MTGPVTGPVTRRTKGAGRRALRLYAGLGPGTVVHVWLRWLSCPFPAVADQVPASGRVLEVGCGHGLFAAYLAMQSPDRDVWGVDLDARKIGLAGRAAARAGDLGAGLQVAVAPSGAVPAGPWAAIAIVDVLYLLDPAAQEALLGECAAQLAPGGVLVVKEMGVRPRWKYCWNVLQETVSVRVLRITEGRREFTFLSPARLGAAMGSAGLALVVDRGIDRFRPHPHHLLVGRRTVTATDRPSAMPV